jgi:predicted RNA-binding protein with PUA domain
MLIRRITLTLPAHLRATATPDARLIAEALGHEMAARGITDARLALALPGAGQSAPVLAARMVSALPKGGRDGG